MKRHPAAAALALLQLIEVTPPLKQHKNATNKGGGFVAWVSSAAERVDFTLLALLFTVEKKTSTTDPGHFPTSSSTNWAPTEYTK